MTLRPVAEAETCGRPADAAATTHTLEPYVQPARGARAMNEQQQQQESGPLTVPWRPSSNAIQAINTSLRGHATSDLWLPSETDWPELQEARTEQLRVRALVAATIASWHALQERYADEDALHSQELIQAHREGRRTARDRRTPAEKRQAELASMAERGNAALVVLAEVVDAAVQTMRDHEQEWLRDLRSEFSRAGEKRQEAERLLDEARVAEYGIAMRGSWLKKEANTGAFGKQPHPEPQLVPAMWSPQMGRPMLERRYYEEQPLVSHQEASGVSDAELRADPADGLPEIPEPDDGQPAADPTGVVSELDESVSGARS